MLNVRDDPLAKKESIANLSRKRFEDPLEHENLK